jgi:hypothetical protein
MPCVIKIHMEPNPQSKQLQYEEIPPAAPAASPPPVETPPPPKQPVNMLPDKDKLLPLILAFFAIVTGVLLFFVLKQLQKKSEAPPPVTIIVTPTPSPTPIRFPTNISTSSAFLDFEGSVASYASNLNAFEKNDPSLSPPSLVLPLGFSN